MGIKALREFFLRIQDGPHLLRGHLKDPHRIVALFFYGYIIKIIFVICYGDLHLHISDQTAKHLLRSESLFSCLVEFFMPLFKFRKDDQGIVDQSLYPIYLWEDNDIPLGERPILWHLKKEYRTAYIPPRISAVFIPG